MELIWNAEDVVRAVSGHSLHEQNWIARGVSIDSRTTKPGDIFIALLGPTHDGHDHVGQAMAAGAVAAIVSRPFVQAPPESPLILCKDTFTALQQLGQAGRERSTASIIAVTGSVGKTGTKEMLRLMLNAMGSTYANEGSLNNQWGVPLSLARMPPEARYGVFELGMNHAGELGPLSLQVRPNVALITTIEAVHLEFFASVEAIADAKAEIFLSMTPGNTAVLNRDNEHFARLAAAAKTRGLKKVLSFGRSSKCDARLKEWTPTLEGGAIRVEILGRKIDYTLGAAGEHLALNSVGALLAAVAAGGDPEACAAALAHYRAPQGRGAVLRLAMPEGTVTLIDESYNASPVAVRSAIRVLDSMTPEGTGGRLLVLGDMRELGEQSVELHTGLAADIAASKINLVFCCGAMMKHVYETLPAERRGGYAEDSATLAPQIIKTLRAGDIITVKGSLSMRMKLVVEALKSHVIGETMQKKTA